MTKHNAANERIKRRYFAYLKEAKRHSEATVDAAAKALHRFETYTSYREFKTFHFEQAIAFKKQFAEQRSQQSGERLSKATVHATLSQLKRFFQWLAFQPGFKSRFQYSDADYFNLSDKDTRIATAQREQRVPTLEQVKYVIFRMPINTEIERRNRALIAFTLLTGARDGAIASTKLKVPQNLSHLFLPVGDEIRRIVLEWVSYLREEKLWGNDDPLFPATRIVLGTTRQFEVSGVEREHWKGASPIRMIFREAFINAGLPYCHPHSFRNTLVGLGQSVCQSPEEFKAWSQNLGHEKVLTTFFSYGEVACERQGEIIRGVVRTTIYHENRLQRLGGGSG